VALVIVEEMTEEVEVEEEAEIAVMTATEDMGVIVTAIEDMGVDAIGVMVVIVIEAMVATVIVAMVVVVVVAVGAVSMIIHEGEVENTVHQEIRTLGSMLKAFLQTLAGKILRTLSVTLVRSVLLM